MLADMTPATYSGSDMNAEVQGCMRVRVLRERRRKRGREGRREEGRDRELTEGERGGEGGC